MNNFELSSIGYFALRASNDARLHGEDAGRRVVVTRQIVDVIVVVDGGVARRLLAQAPGVVGQGDHLAFVRYGLHVVLVSMGRLEESSLKQSMQHL